jgi:hypothetical protein
LDAVNQGDVFPEVLDSFRNKDISMKKILIEISLRMAILVAHFFYKKNILILL